MFQIQTLIYCENAYGPITNFARTGMGPQSGGCRPQFYNNVVSRYFSKMLFAENPENFPLLLSEVYLKKVTEISSKTV